MGVDAPRVVTGGACGKFGSVLVTNIGKIRVMLAKGSIYEPRAPRTRAGLCDSYH